ESPSRNRRRRIDQGEGAFQPLEAAPAVGHGYRLIGFTPWNPSAVLALQSVEPGQRSSTCCQCLHLQRVRPKVGSVYEWGGITALLSGIDRHTRDRFEHHFAKLPGSSRFWLYRRPQYPAGRAIPG